MTAAIASAAALIGCQSRCFADAGTDMTKIDTPFLIATDGELTLAFSDVKLVSAAEGAAPCP